MHKRLVAGLSRLVTCLQSNFIGTNFLGFCSNLGVRGLFRSPFVSYWVHTDWLAPGYLMGAGDPTISRETDTQVPAACQPQPRQPHINYLRNVSKILATLWLFITTEHIKKLSSILVTFICEIGLKNRWCGQFEHFRLWIKRWFIWQDHPLSSDYLLWTLFIFKHWH